MPTPQAGDALMPGVRWLWCDSGLWVLEKASGVPVLTDRTGTPCLLDALRAWHGARPQRPRPRLVHRIDKDTSGLLLVALSDAVERALGAAFEQRSVRKWYVAQTTVPLPGDRRRGAERHRIDLPLRTGRKGLMRIAGLREHIESVPEAGRWLHRLAPGAEQAGALAALTEARHLGHQRYLIRLHTGRTHQIRVHFAWLGAPLLGEPRYGAPKAPAQHASRLALHCHRLGLPDLGDGLPRPQAFRSPLPEDFPEASAERVASRPAFANRLGATD